MKLSRMEWIDRDLFLIPGKRVRDMGGIYTQSARRRGQSTGDRGIFWRGNNYAFSRSTKKETNAQI